MGTIISRKIKCKSRADFPVNVERYESAQDVVNDCKTRKRTDSNFKDYETYQTKMNFEMVESYQEALDLLSKGYQPSVEGLGRALRTNKKGIEKRVKFENNVYGFAPVVPLAIKGIPQSMVNQTMKPIKCKVIDVYYEMTVCWSVSTETIIENGKKVLSAIIDLEKQGYRFNLYSVQSYSNGTGADVLCVKVKSSDKPLDLKRISFPLTHPAFFRVIGFDWYGKCPVAKYRDSYGHSITRELSEADKKEFIKQMFGENAHYITADYMGDHTETDLKEVFINA